MCTRKKDVEKLSCGFEVNNNSHYMNKIQGGDNHLTYRFFTFMV